MIELGQLEAAHPEFEKRQARVIAVSLEDVEAARQTQADFPHLTILADADRKLADALDVIHHNSAPGGGDTTAPTTLIVDRQGIVRWTFRPDRFLERLSPGDVLAALERSLPGS